MEKEIDRMMLFRRLSIIFAVVFLVTIAAMVALFIVMGMGDYGGANSDFAVIDDYGEVSTKTVKFEKSNALWFFYEGNRSERTLFLDEVPNLKIVNSEEYYLEVKAPKGLLDKLVVKNTEEGLLMTFGEKYYNAVQSGEKLYYGLYVNCDVFEVVVHAPINRLYSSAEFNLDYDTPKTDLLAIVVGGEVREGKVYNVDATNFLCQLSGASTVEMAGKVSGEIYFEVWHDSKIHAEGLQVNDERITTAVQSKIFGFSYISGSTFSAYNLLSWGTMITSIIVFSMFASVFLAILFKILMAKQKKEIDKEIEILEKEANFLNNAQKNDEKILQNE